MELSASAITGRARDVIFEKNHETRDMKFNAFREEYGPRVVLNTFKFLIDPKDYSHKQRKFIAAFINSLSVELDKPLEILGFASESSEKEVNSNSLPQIINIPENEKLEALDCKQASDAFEQRLESDPLLKYASTDEKQQILAARGSENLDDICTKVTTGQWKLLLDTYGNEKPLSFVLLAAYLNEGITIEDLASGMMLHRAYLNDPIGITIYDINSVMDKNLFNSDWLIEQASSIKENQRFLYTIKKIPDGFQENSNLYNSTTGIFYLKSNPPEVGIASFGLAKTWYSRLTPRLHLTPSIVEMARNLKKGQEDFGLFLPGEEVNIHGFSDCGIFSFLHELGHARYRNKVEPMNFEKDVTNVLDLQEVLLPIRPQYELKLSKEDEDSFDTPPTLVEFACYVIDRASGMFLDGVKTRGDRRFKTKKFITDVISETSGAEQWEGLSAGDVLGAIRDFLRAHKNTIPELVTKHPPRYY